MTIAIPGDEEAVKPKETKQELDETKLKKKKLPRFKTFKTIVLAIFIQFIIRLDA